MIQGSISVPQPYTNNLIADLGLYEKMGIDGVLNEYIDYLRIFLENRSYDNYKNVIEFVIKYKSRFDWIMISFNPAKAISDPSSTSTSVV